LLKVVFHNLLAKLAALIDFERVAIFQPGNYILITILLGVLEESMEHPWEQSLMLWWAVTIV
jgi:hypothetical protein